MRLRANGAFDRSFGGDGFAPINWQDVLLRKDGRILVVGASEPAGDLGETDLTVTRLRPNGMLDPTFGGDGVVSVDLGRQWDRGSTLAMAPAGKILVGGTSTSEKFDRGFSDSVAVIGQLRPDGKLDRTFSHDGLTTLSAAGPIFDIVNAPRGGILVAADEYASAMLFRLRPSGALESSFGQMGSMPISLKGTSLEGNYFSPIPHIGMLADGRFILAGTFSLEMTGQQNYSAIAARYFPDGRLDASYGVNGFAKAGFPGVTFPSAFVVRRDGRLFIGADTADLVSNIHRFGAIAFRPSGSLDRRFGHSGMTLSRFPGNSWLQDLTFQGANRIVLVGWSRLRNQPNKTTVSRLGLPHY